MFLIRTKSTLTQYSGISRGRSRGTRGRSVSSTGGGDEPPQQAQNDEARNLGVINEDEVTDAEKDIVINSRWRCTQLIDSGAFGKVYLAIDERDGRQYAVKLESPDLAHKQLEFEAAVYNELAGGPGIPAMHYFKDNALVLDLLGPSLEQLLNFCGRRFSLKTVLLLGMAMLDRLEYLHERNIIHRDVKPNNFAIGHGEKGHIVHMIDYGLSKQYYFPDTGAHISFRDKKRLTGTARYASVRNHQGVEPTRRDDIESLAYVLLYFYRGALPWQNIKADTKQMKYQQILKRKHELPLRVICGEDTPEELFMMLAYSRALGFFDQPDYGLIRRNFKNLFERSGFVDDNEFDWTLRMREMGITELPRKAPPRARAPPHPVPAQ